MTTAHATTEPASPAAPAWFNNRILEGLQFLWALGLPGTPAAELANLTASAWIAALWQMQAWDEELDSYRLHEGFMTAAVRADRWPAPRTITECLGPRPRPRGAALPYHPQPPSDEQRARMGRLGRRASDRSADAAQPQGATR